MTPDDCGTIDPLLSLYADGMTSAEEAQRVKTHLPGCPACRESLAWMQATQRALDSRPVVSPPADLRARIAAAIAASSTVPVPTSFTGRPARAFALRPAFAAAASLTVLGVVSYSLLLRQPQVAVHPVKSQQVAAGPPVNLSPPVIKPLTGPHIKPPVSHHTTIAPRPGHSDPDLVARAQPDESQPEPTEVRTPAESSRPKATTIPAPVVALIKPRSVLAKKPSLPKFKPELMATTKQPVSLDETHKAPVIKPEDKKPDVVVAMAPRTPVSTAPVLIEKHPVIIQDPAPTVVVTSSHEVHAQTADMLGPVKARLGAMQSFTHATIGKAENGAVLASRTIEPGETAYIDGIHSR